jgi:hypothetical protein
MVDFTAYLGSLVYVLQTTFRLFGYLIISLCLYLMKVIPEKYRTNFAQRKKLSTP